MHLPIKPTTGIQVQQPTLYLHIVVDVLRLFKSNRVGYLLRVRVCFHKHHKPSSISAIPPANSTFVQYATDFMAETNLDIFAVIWPTSNAVSNRKSSAVC